MTSLDRAVVAITGAGSGIGRALSLELAGCGVSLALSDRDADGLQETAQLLKARFATTEVRTDIVDVAEGDAMTEWASAVADQFGRVNVVVNNAGVAFSGDVLDSTLDDLRWVMGINFWGVVHGTTAFLPHLVASGSGHVVNLSSLFGLIAIPSQSQYVAAKFAVRGWTEALRQELLMSKIPVQVSAVHPGGIKTSIARSARTAVGYDQRGLAEFFDNSLAKMSPERAALIIRRGIERNKPRIIVGADAKALDLLQRTTGPHYQRLIAAVLARSGMMGPTRKQVV